MGPRLDNRGWAARSRPTMPDSERASMGPRLDNRGWAPVKGGQHRGLAPLQWVHGWITVVGLKMNWHIAVICEASMGPRLDNRGWAAPMFPSLPRPNSFNGSTVG